MTRGQGGQDPRPDDAGPDAPYGRVMEIRPLTPGLVDEYLRLFDGAFSDNPEWAGCYCAFYDDGFDDGSDPSDPGADVRNRAARRATIEAGRAAGLLAYVDEQPIGWVNAAPRDSYGNLRGFAAAAAPGQPAVGSIMCFVIAPEHRGQGVASALLAATDDHLRGLGMAVAEAYPRQAPPAQPDLPWTAAYYKGSPGMYRRAGFTVHRELDGFTVMRKPL